MKRKQRVLLNRIKNAIKKGREKGYLETTGTIYARFSHNNEETEKEYACAYGALAAGLDIDIRPPNEEFLTEDYLDNITAQVNTKLGLEGYCADRFYPTIYSANDSNGSIAKRVSRDEYAIEAIEKKLESDPEFCN